MPPKKTKQFQPDMVSFLLKIDFVDLMTPVDRKKFLGLVAQIVNNEAFGKVIDNLLNEIACCGIHDGVDNLKVAAPIQTILAIKRRFEKLNARFISETQGAEDFDEHAPL